MQEVQYILPLEVLPLSLGKLDRSNGVIGAGIIGHQLEFMLPVVIDSKSLLS
jgi:hypothetical protein